MGGAPGVCVRSGGQSTGVSSCLLGGRPLPKLGDCSRCARPAGTLAAEQYVLPGKAGQNMIALSFPACGRGNSARRALPGESVGRKGGLGPSGLFAGCRPDLLGVPYRASPLDGRGAGYPIGNRPPPKSLLCSLTRKKRSKSGYADGHRNSPTTGTMRHNRQNERVPTSGS